MDILTGQYKVEQNECMFVYVRTIMISRVVDMEVDYLWHRLSQAIVVHVCLGYRLKRFNWVNTAFFTPLVATVRVTPAKFVSCQLLVPI